ncbi:MAG: hypothetical protein ACOC38_12755 [Promethearchaeia archaeon]
MNAIQIRYRDFVSEWYDRYELADFDKFIYLWISFNAYLSQRSGETSGRNMIEWFKENQKSRYLELLQKDEKLRDAVDWFVGQGVTNMKSGDYYKPENEKDFENIVEVIYQVRCNLFHGSKSRDATIDRDIVVNATKVLDGLFRPLLLSDRRFRNSLTVRSSD